MITRGLDRTAAAQGAQVSVRKGKILVCAHSNAAVDELLGRMLSGRASFVDEFGRPYTPSIVRLGSGATS